MLSDVNVKHQYLDFSSFRNNILYKNVYWVIVNRAEWIIINTHTVAIVYMHVQHTIVSKAQVKA